MSEEEKIVDGVHNYSTEDEYILPKELKVLEQLEWFKDQKLAIMMHWGAYSQLGIVESWALSDQDAEWSRDIDWDITDDEFKNAYKDLNKTFNPIRFDPYRWADFAENAGFKYLIFTTKHHDGFCMWDSKYSDYKITNKDCPFNVNKYADVCKHLFEAFRRKNMGISAYFSKADWNIDSYWAKNQKRGSFMWRGSSYIPKDNPELWEKFVQFTHNQLRELTTEYGKIDILWFDAGWVCEKSGQDIRLGEIIDEIRTYQPWILSADRTIGGAYENYVTPEQCVPEKPLNIPWESCITIGNSFAYAYDDTYKTSREIIHLLINIVAKGGNLALNIAPQPDGRLPKKAMEAMTEMGEWLKINGDAIYGTRVCAPYKVDKIAFTKKGESVFAIKLYDEQEEISSQFVIKYKGEIKEIKKLGSDKQVKFEIVPEGIKIIEFEATEINQVADVFELK